MNIFDYSDEEIQTFAFKHMGELLSAALLMTHIKEDTIAPPPEGASPMQETLWRVIQLANHPEAEEFHRYQLIKFLVDLENSATLNP